MLMLFIITIKDFVDQKQIIMKLNCCKVRRRFLFLSSNWLYSFRVTIVRHSQYLSIKSDSDDEVVLSIEADFLREFSEIFFPWPGIFFVIFSSFFRFKLCFLIGMVVSSKCVNLTCLNYPDDIFVTYQ